MSQIVFNMCAFGKTRLVIHDISVNNYDIRSLRIAERHKAFRTLFADQSVSRNPKPKEYACLPEALAETSAQQPADEGGAGQVL